MAKKRIIKLQKDANLGMGVIKKGSVILVVESDYDRLKKQDKLAPKVSKQEIEDYHKAQARIDARANKKVKR